MPPVGAAEIARAEPGRHESWSLAAWIFSATAAVALVAVAAFAASHGRTLEIRPAEPAVQPQASTAAQPAPSENAAAQPPPPMGALVVNAEPKTASIQLDDGDDQGPRATFAGLLPGSHHRLQIRAAGYEPKSIEFDSSAGRSLMDVSLVRKAAPRAGRPPGATSKRDERMINPDQPIDPWRH